MGRESGSYSAICVPFVPFYTKFRFADNFVSRQSLTNLTTLALRGTNNVSFMPIIGREGASPPSRYVGADFYGPFSRVIIRTCAETNSARETTPLGGIAECGISDY